MAQQKPPQQVSPATQKVLAQQVEPLGIQNGAMLEEVGMQQDSVIGVNEVLLGRCVKISRIPCGLKHSQLMLRAPRSLLLLGNTHASPAVTLR